VSWKEKGHKSIPQAQYVTLRIKKSDEEKPKCVGLAQQIGFVPAYVHSLLRLVKGAAKLCTY
jgi:hypothetical protein